MVPQYLETDNLLYARISVVAFFTQRYGAMTIDEISSMIVLCNRMIARNPEIELMQLLISETIYAKSEGSGYEIPKLRETLQQIKDGKLNEPFSIYAADIKCSDGGMYKSTDMRSCRGFWGLSDKYLEFIEHYIKTLNTKGWSLKKLISVANKYPEMQAALKEPDLRVWDDMHLLEASPDIPNLGELTDAQKELKYSQ